MQYIHLSVKNRAASYHTSRRSRKIDTLTYDMKAIRCVSITITALLVEAVAQNSLRKNLHRELFLEDGGSSLCRSVIAISDSPDYRYLEEQGIDPLEYEHDEEFVCEISHGQTIPIRGTAAQLDQMRRLLNEGSLISSETSVAVSDTEIVLDGEDSIYLPPGQIKLVATDSNIRRTASNRREKRSLAVYEGDQTVLVVRVTDASGNVIPDDAKTISDKVFGTYGDSVNLKSQLAACSFDKLRVTKNYSEDISKYLSAPGVVDISIPVSLSDSNRATVRAAAVAAVEEKLKVVMPGPFDHVMFVLEGCYIECGWAGYAFVNSWLSIFQGKNYKLAGVQLHEIGHNLNLAHSGGLDGKPYSDHSCLMGNPWYSDESGAMCFNPAKSFQIANAGNAWYNARVTDTQVWNPADVKVEEWNGRIIGVADYNNNPDGHLVVVKIESGSTNDFFVGFNRAAGINRHNKQASNEVTIVQAGSDGLGYSQSFLKAALKEGESYVISGWGGTNKDVTIEVHEINMNAEPAYASVTMRLRPVLTGRPTKKPTVAPTPSPTTAKPSPRPSTKPTKTQASSRPSTIPTKKPTTDPTLKPTSRPSTIPTNNPSTTPTSKPSSRLSTLPTIEPSSAPTSRPIFTRTSSVPTKSPFQYPPNDCGDSSCGYDETSESCPSDCFAQELLTTFEYNLGSTGTMFEIKASKDVSVRSFDINAMSRGNGNVKVYTRLGSYKGHEQNSEQWTLVYDNVVMHNKRGEATHLGAFESDVVIEANGTQSFFVSSTKGILYNSGTTELSQFASDGVISVSEGIGTTGEFSGVWHSPRVWSGIIRYEVSNPCGDSICSLDENSTSCLADCHGREIETTYDFDLGSKGSMFKINTSRDVMITTFQINAIARGRGTVKVYTRKGNYIGKETVGTGWTLVYQDDDVMHNARGQVTELGVFESIVPIASGTSQSFYITSTKGLLYKSGGREHDAYASDGTLTIFEGIGLDANFTGPINRPRVWCGRITYNID